MVATCRVGMVTGLQPHPSPVIFSAPLACIQIGHLEAEPFVLGEEGLQ